MTETPALAKLVQSILFIEQPIKRAVALGRPVEALGPAEIAGSSTSRTASWRSFPAALALGYSGVSSKNCKGFYKSLLNAARVAKLNAAAGTAALLHVGRGPDDLGRRVVQQDLALVSLIGLTHVERNGHHFIDGMSSASDAEQNAFVAAHPGLYERQPGRPARLKVRDGALSLGSLGCPGFAVGVDLDFAALRAMPDAPRERLVPAHPGGKK
jgi:hypothetical protein